MNSSTVSYEERAESFYPLKKTMDFSFFKHVKLGQTAFGTLTGAKREPKNRVYQGKYSNDVRVLPDNKDDWKSEFTFDDVRFQTFEEIIRLGYLEWSLPSMIDVVKGNRIALSYSNLTQARMLQDFFKSISKKNCVIKVWTKGEKEFVEFLETVKEPAENWWKEFSCLYGFDPFNGGRVRPVELEDIPIIMPARENEEIVTEVNNGKFLRRTIVYKNLDKMDEECGEQHLYFEGSSEDEEEKPRERMFNKRRGVRIPSKDVGEAIALEIEELE